MFGLHGISGGVAKEVALPTPSVHHPYTAPEHRWLQINLDPVTQIHESRDPEAGPVTM